MKFKRKNILQSLINGEKSFCTLCFSSIEDLESYLIVTDIVILKSEYEKSIVDILNFVLAPGIATDFLTSYICMPCFKSALSSYLFIKTAKENSEYLSKTIKNVTNILKSNLEENLEFCKTVYLLSEDSKFSSCYDTQCEIDSIETAKLRLDTILLEENNEENVISIDIEFEQQENEQLQYREEENEQDKDELLQHREEENEQLQHIKDKDEQLQHREEENEQLQYREEENEQLQHIKEEDELLQHREKDNEQLQYREKENEQLQYREKENEQPQCRNEQNEQLQYRDGQNEQLQCRAEKKQLQHRKANTKHSDLENMFERGGKRVQCKLCKVFTSINYFRSHYYRQHAPKTIKCPKCPKLFGSTSILNKHRYENHTEAICTECGKAFNNYRYLRKHKQSHQISFPCEKCKYVYKSKETYDRHLKFQICGQKQKKTQALFTFADTIFTCDICNKNYCHKNSLKRHIGLMHGDGKAYVCGWCDKKYSTQSHLNAHTVIHTEHKKFSCTTCNSKFSTKRSLTVHTNPYKCADCDASFFCSTQRSMHVQHYHRQLQQNLQFECDLCFGKFKYKRGLVKHKKTVKCS
ncbi:zinc finger protein 141-like isoform X3 [Maniola jurtina]|uniref:zinc finger protein 141-like isoform X3 n=1 Tax=Maniola jurtina TaxID=191418 RepID=UPI001E68B14D|nr:zinc finger protein 141-like isoform X3 [Maniola jurtina]